MELNYKFLYKTWKGFKIADNLEVVGKNNYNIVMDQEELITIKKELAYLEELREDSRKYIMELNSLNEQNKALTEQNQLLQQVNINQKKEQTSKKITCEYENMYLEQKRILNRKDEKNKELNKQLNNLRLMIDSKNKKVSRLENKVTKLENKCNKKFKKKKIEVKENEILSSYKSFTINTLSRKNYKVEKHYILNIELEMPVGEVKTYIENIQKEVHDKIRGNELVEYLIENDYTIWKVQTKNNEWEVVLLRKELKDEIENIDFSYKSFILEKLNGESYYKLHQHYVLPIPIETAINEVVEYINQSKTTNIALDNERINQEKGNEKNIYENIPWKIQTKNDMWEVIFKGKFDK